jgi:hypothetical protein
LSIACASLVYALNQHQQIDFGMHVPSAIIKQSDYFILLFIFFLCFFFFFKAKEHEEKYTLARAFLCLRKRPKRSSETSRHHFRQGWDRGTDHSHFSLLLLSQSKSSKRFINVVRIHAKSPYTHVTVKNIELYF